MNIKITSKDGVKLLTKDKFCDDDISITLDESLLGTPEVEYPNEAIKYYKENRNKNWPYFPLPSEMSEEEDCIYILYNADDNFCDVRFLVKYNNINCTIQKYYNNQLISENHINETQLDNRGYFNDFFFSNKDEDWTNYNYILVVLKGKINQFNIGTVPYYEGTYLNNYVIGEILEISGKCESCKITTAESQSSSPINNAKMRYFSFTGINITDFWSRSFMNNYSLLCIPEFQSNAIPYSGETFKGCWSLKFQTNYNTSELKSLSYAYADCRNIKKVVLDCSKATDLSYCFSGNYELEEVVLENMNKNANVTIIRNIFEDCYKLKKVTGLDLSQATNPGSIFRNCYFIEEIDDLILNEKLTDLYGWFQYCYNLIKAPNMNTENIKSVSYLFMYCSKLEEIPEYDFINVTNISSAFNGCINLKKFGIKNIKVSFSLKDSIMLSSDELVKILNNLATVETTQTLTLGSTLLAKLTDEEKAIATNKNWTLA